ncbi:MAG: indole-3-glycerol phosphate synthase TrpC [Candidatus Omnitrophica bacterium]|nr:indole-3-glycerol phosphate synthase TrpC [Candidatus Omnitrophota bacterium]MDE2009078.1 indole-3-glycerol phosphate synthase TrpC [Candidatus Omnitrophota bacterium]MDE2214257.1 indole-3-glycerol phosphate synthase TrpC [Candidatus Omnitrophota bacterium]MDE2231294.1 indole-3-glycerol phosphate synthase TrpC [Candidatus Omnitrophota bacterium]
MARHKLEALEAKKAYYDNLIKNMKPLEGERYKIFKKAISKPGGINLIAEIKKASPSAGLIREDFDAPKIARIYVENNVAAISVLTEDKYFLGKFSYLSQVARHAPVPVLMKDFIVHEYQIYEGLFYGASAALLIVAMLTNSQLRSLMQAAHHLGLDCLVEVHDEIEMERALACGAEIIGINNRSLQTLNVDLNNCLKIIPLIPKGIVIVAESGLKTYSDVVQVSKAGAHAVLIGEAFMRSADIGAKIREVMHGTR